MYCKWFEEECKSKELLKERESEAITHDDFGNSIEPIYDCDLDCKECQYVQLD